MSSDFVWGETEFVLADATSAESEGREQVVLGEFEDFAFVHVGAYRCLGGCSGVWEDALDCGSEGAHRIH